jgi:hypothetical protein
MAEKKQHIMTTSTGTKIAVTLADEYSSIKDIVGIKAAGNKDVPDASSNVNDLRKYGEAIELTVRYKGGGSNRILCEISKVSGAINGLVSKSINGKTITSARIPRHRSRR